MERWSGKVAIVTGASVGIGAGIVKAFVKHGLKVIGCGRNLDNLKELEASVKPQSAGSFKPVKCDVTSEEEIKAMFEIARREYGGLHILVNNAGINRVAPLLSGETKDFRDISEVNVIGLTVCAREAVKLMREKNIDDGHIFNLCSTSGHIASDSSLRNFYSATKFAVNAITIGLRNELGALGSHIRVTQISPGVVETEIVSRTRGPEAANKLYSSIQTLQPGDVADTVIHALSAPAHCGIHDVILLPVEQPLRG